MNLIQELQATPKWKKFEEWYILSEVTVRIPLHVGRYNFPPFKEMNLYFQKGVFEKFIESQGLRCEQECHGKQMSYYIWTEENGFEYKDSFEQLLIWYFNL